MKRSTSRALRQFLAVTAVAGLASCSGRALTRPAVPTGGSSGNSEPVSEATLATNQARWTAAGMDSYRYRFAWECFCTEEYVRVVDIRVLHGAIVSVTDAETGQPVSAEAAARYRTIDGLFAFVRSAFDYPAASIMGAFDARLGYPSAMNVDYVAGIADEEKGFRIYSLTLLR